jgi:hypothetical protein
MTQKSFISRGENNSANSNTPSLNSLRAANGQNSNCQDQHPMKRPSSFSRYETYENHIQQYLSLLSEKISMMNMKIDNLKSENTQTLKSIDKRTKILAEKMEEICGIINDGSSISTMNDDDDDENHEYCEDESEDNSDNEDNSSQEKNVCDDCYIKCQQGKKIPKNIKYKKDVKYESNKKNKEYYDDKDCCNDTDCCDESSKPKGIIVKFNGKSNTSFNPLDFLMNLTQSLKTKEPPKEIDSDDEYDDEFKIYDENDEINIDPNYVNMDDKLENINDIIKIGEKYQKLADKIKLTKTEKIEKKEIKKKKTKEEKEDDECSDSDGIFDVFDIKKKEKNKDVLDQDQPQENMFCKFFVLDGKKYNINLKTVCKLAQPLKKLNRMIGLKSVKEQIFEMIIYYLQGFENENKNMLHSVIEGPPGVGKTKLGKIMAQVYCALDIIPSSRFKYVKATDLIGDHVGATKHMTQTIIDEADGGVLFIDEAYALSTSETKDPYGKECMDTLNFNLSENKKKLIVIIAGYPDQLEKCFFSHNPGLQRRFPFRYRVDKYSAKELSEIFQDKLKRYKWKISKDITPKYLEDFFKSNVDEFKNFGGDIENFFKKCQFSHSKRTIGLHPAYRGKLTIDDLNDGLKSFKQNKKKDDEHMVWKQMFV